MTVQPRGAKATETYRDAAPGLYIVGEPLDITQLQPEEPPLHVLCAAWEDVQRTRLALLHRGLELSDAMEKIEDAIGRKVVRELRKHPLWPWLSQFPGLGGIHTARLISIIGDPRRFPGQPCTMKHIQPPIYEIGAQCPVVGTDREPCEGLMLPPRSTTGVASLWKYCGLHAVNGKSPRKTRGKRTDYNVKARTCILQPDGIADQIIRRRVPHYRDIYDTKKASLISERGVEASDGTENVGAPALTNAEDQDETISGSGVQEGSQGEMRHVPGSDPALRPFQLNAIARKVAAKAFVGDLLTAWKAIT